MNCHYCGGVDTYQNTVAQHFCPSGDTPFFVDNLPVSDCVLCGDRMLSNSAMDALDSINDKNAIPVRLRAIPVYDFNALEGHPQTTMVGSYAVIPTLAAGFPVYQPRLERFYVDQGALEVDDHAIGLAKETASGGPYFFLDERHHNARQVEAIVIGASAHVPAFMSVIVPSVTDLRVMDLRQFANPQHRVTELKRVTG